MENREWRRILYIIRCKMREVTIGYFPYFFKKKHGKSLVLSMFLLIFAKSTLQKILTVNYSVSTPKQ